MTSRQPAVRSPGAISSATEAVDRAALHPRLTSPCWRGRTLTLIDLDVVHRLAIAHSIHPQRPDASIGGRGRSTGDGWLPVDQFFERKVALVEPAVRAAGRLRSTDPWLLMSVEPGQHLAVKASALGVDAVDLHLHCTIGRRSKRARLPLR